MRHSNVAASTIGGPHTGSAWWEIAIVFCFEVLTDIAFLPPLLIMHRYRRHFELYIGAFQLVSGFLYNFCNALNVSVFLTEQQWHGLNNILTTTYFLLLLIHLQANSNPTVDIMLRYAAFTAVWIAQIKDEYSNPQWTAVVVLAFCIMPVCKFGGAMRLPPYDAEKLCKGFFAGVGAAICFLIGLDDTVDPFRLFHGLSQALVGLALYYLWQLVPLSLAKRDEDLWESWQSASFAKRQEKDSDRQEGSVLEGPRHTRGMSGGMGPRVSSFSTVDLPVTRLEYY